MHRKGATPILDIVSLILLFALSVSYLWTLSFAGNFFGGEDLQEIGALRTPSNVAYGDAFLNMPFVEDLTIADFIVQASEEDYVKLRDQMNIFFKDTEFEWYLAIYLDKDDENPKIVYGRENWRFRNGFNGYEDYLIPNYVEGNVMKVTLAIDKGIWIPGEEAEERYYNAPGSAIGQVV
ncbi:hypothetical protein HOF78_00395 [Candidatus Woesearchaeota archaeon]|nr:hypothetical protein [Candidatus Woesearchaeota archaeon]MBT6044574.1 hypothetical protein [Candidatus Woesearchaeota archaeon]